MDISEKSIRRLRRNLLVTQIFSVISSLLMLAMLVGGFWAFRVAQEYAAQVDVYVTEVMTYAADMEPVIQELSKLDMQTLNHTMEQMTIAFADVDFEKLAQQIEELDVDAINTTIDKLDVDAMNAKIEALDVDALNAKIAALDIDAINKMLQGLDTKELSVALENLNDASDKVKEISEKLRKAVAIFG